MRLKEYNNLKVCMQTSKTSQERHPRGEEREGKKKHEKLPAETHTANDKL
jgi:hypothetical protein